MRTERQTHTYKVVGDCEIKADVFPAGASPCPVVVAIHGGALIMGSRTYGMRCHLDAYLAAGYTLVSIDYRLAPETRLPDIIEDVQDACRWVREEGPHLFGADPGRLAVVGHSAGGYLTLMTGFRVSPPPRALISFYGYGDIAGAWYSRPDPFYCQQPPVPADEAYAAVGGRVISESHGPGRELFYLWCRQQGRWPQEVAGHDPDAEPGAFGLLCPVRNVTADYPPTILLHGDSDTDVPYQQSVMMADALRRAGVNHELVTIPGGGHGFDAADTTAARAAFARVLGFLQAHL
jgi:acetyl esterase/lipase